MTQTQTIKLTIDMKKFFVLAAMMMVVSAAVAQQTAAFHPWQGKKVAYFGDSITDPNIKASKVKYWGFLEQWLNITPYVYGVSGREWTDIPRQADQLKKDHADDFDAIMIFMGTNDYNSGVKIGEWYTEKEEEVEYACRTQKALVKRERRYPNMDNNTYKGRINIALSKIKSMYPDKQVVLLTPIHRSIFHSGNTNWQCSEDYTNQCGEYIDAYVEAVKEAGLVWSIPVIDLNSLCGLYPLLPEHAKFFNNDRDLLHPNDLGHERMAKTIMQQLIGIPLF